MKTCTRCGASHDDNAKFCTSCGAAFEAKAETANENINDNVFGAEQAYQAPTERPGSRQMNVGQLVWSIINVLACCTPLGIAGLILTIMAQSAATAAEEESKLKTAKTINIIGTVAGVVVFIVSFIWGIIMGLETNYEILWIR